MAITDSWGIRAGYSNLDVEADDQKLEKTQDRNGEITLAYALEADTTLRVRV